MSIPIINPNTSYSMLLKQIYPSNAKKEDLNLIDLHEKDLYEFFSSHDEIEKSTTFNKIDSLSTAPSKSTDFIHFIWMGNPINPEYLSNILTWKNHYPQKAIIIWVDQDSLKDTNLINFAKKNNIKLIDIEKVFNDKNTFDLYEIIKLEKKRLPPNWGAVSDIYRYLIMYYFAGTYSDTDSKITETDTEIDFDINMAFSQIDEFNNDRIMIKNIRDDFWIELLEEIKNRYQECLNLTSSEEIERLTLPNKIEFRKISTIQRTGPGLLYEFILGLKNIQFLTYRGACDYTWSAKLTFEKCKSLMTKTDIIERIASNIIVDLIETRKLRLKRYNIFFRSPLPPSKSEWIRNPVKKPPLLSNDDKKVMLDKLEQKLNQIDPACELQYAISTKNETEHQRFSLETRKNKMHN